MAGTNQLSEQRHRDILAGISVMVHAIANRQNLADQPHMQDDGNEVPVGGELTPEEQPCGLANDAGHCRSMLRRCKRVCPQAAPGPRHQKC